jgi:phosphoglycerol transferase
VPFDYGSDALSHHMAIKSVLDHGWYWKNALLGMPTGLEMYDCPFVLGDSFHLLVLKLIGLFTRSSSLATNLYFLLGFPLATLTMVVALRRLRVSFPAALVAGVLFAFLPFHMQRGEVHIFIATYYAVPLLMLVALWLGEPVTLLAPAQRRRAVASVAICLLVSTTGMYQAFFACVLLLLAGAVAAARHRSVRHGLAALALVGVIGLSLGVAAAPVLAYERVHGPNPATVVKRSFSESEVFGLKISHLVLPRLNHRVERLAKLNRIYVNLPLENNSSALGLVGTAGFLSLLAFLLLRRRRDTEAGLADRLAELNLGAVLFATVGGFGVVFAVLVTPQFRGQNRIFPFVACLSLAAVALGLDRLQRRWRRVAWAACALVLLAGLYDQTSKKDVRDYAAAAREFNSDRDMVKAIEARVPRGAMIFQLPFVSFPERGYDQLRPYFHSATLRWSFPAMSGRETATWLQQIAALPNAELLDAVARAGFDGILIDRKEYGRAGPLEAGLTVLLNQVAFVSANGRYSFFGTAVHRQDLRGRVTEPVWNEQVQGLMHPLWVGYGAGFFPAEQVGAVTMHFCGADGTLELLNRSTRPRSALLSFKAISASPGPARIALSGPLAETVNAAPEVAVVRTIGVAPGRSLLRVRADGAAVPHGKPEGGRSAVFRVEGLSLLYLDPE